MVLHAGEYYMIVPPVILSVNFRPMIHGDQTAKALKDKIIDVLFKSGGIARLFRGEGAGIDR